MTRKLMLLLYLVTALAFCGAYAVAGVIDDRGDWPCDGKHSDPNTVDWNIDGNQSDWSDQGLLPTASHLYQHFEWLGATVDQEAGVNNPTDGADNNGLLGVVIGGGYVRVNFSVSTSYAVHKPDGWYPKGGNELVDCWIDWNNNGTFDHPGEYIGRWKSDPNTWGGVSVRAGSIVGTAAGAAGTYNVRLRLNWSMAQPVAAPGGAVTWGEVEDYKVFSATAGTVDPPTPVPSLTTYGIIALVLLLLGTAVWVTRRNRAGDLA